MKLSTCPGLHPKYSTVLAGRYIAALLAVTTAVLSIVAHSASVDTSRTWPSLTAEWGGELRGVGLRRRDLRDD
jgi:hypothetical protein